MAKWIEIDPAVSYDIYSDTFIHHKCSACNAPQLYHYICDWTKDDGIVEIGLKEYAVEYCPHCGAKMEYIGESWYEGRMDY